jgi:hypothetical protein
LGKDALAALQAQCHADAQGGAAGEPSNAA